MSIFGRNARVAIWEAALRGLIFERDSFGANPGAKDIARHLYSRMYCGKVVVVADDPVRLLAMLRKQWHHLTRKVQEERAKSADAAQVAELTRLITRMQELAFTTDYPAEEYQGDVHIATPEAALRRPPQCRTMYVACAVEPAVPYMLSAWMPADALVVVCELAA